MSMSHARHCIQVSNGRGSGRGKGMSAYGALEGGKDSKASGRNHRPELVACKLSIGKPGERWEGWVPGGIGVGIGVEE